MYFIINYKNSCLIKKIEIDFNIYLLEKSECIKKLKRKRNSFAMFKKPILNIIKSFKLPILISQSLNSVRNKLKYAEKSYP